MKVCILAAGTGSRLGHLSLATHKALLPVGNQAVLSRIFGQFPPGSEFVLAVGYKGRQIRDFVALAHPDLDVTFVEVDPWEGPGSGPGTSLFACRAELQAPFAFTACDTLIDGDLPQPSSNWIGVARVSDIEKWCSAQVDPAGMVVDLFYKMAGVPTDLAFVGIAFVRDVRSFWQALEAQRARGTGEIQVDAGLLALRDAGLRAYPIGWQDTGDLDTYRALQLRLGANYSFEGKSTEITYRYGDRIVKSFDTEEAADARQDRARVAGAVFSAVVDRRGTYLSYRFQPGIVLSEVLDAAECRRFLEWAQAELWQERAVASDELSRSCEAFYFGKTKQRLDRATGWRRVAELEAAPVRINGTQSQPVRVLLESAAPMLRAGALASTYHGDLHADNVIKTADSYVLIDWRDAFGELRHVGDRYYDLAKFLHTLDLSVRTMAEADAWSAVREASGDWCIDHKCTFREIDARDAFWAFCAEHGYDRRRIASINALVFINMAPLYEPELGLYLYLLGRYLLQAAIDAPIMTASSPRG